MNARWDAAVGASENRVAGESTSAFCPPELPNVATHSGSPTGTSAAETLGVRATTATIAIGMNANAYRSQQTARWYGMSTSLSGAWPFGAAKPPALLRALSQIQA